VSTLRVAEAREAARAALADSALGNDPLVSKRKAIAWRQFLNEKYEPWVTEHRKSGAATVARLRASFAEFNGTSLSDLSAFAIERWRTKRIKAGLKQVTVNRDLAALRSALTTARSWGLLSSHPMASVKMAKVDAIGHVRFLSEDEAARLQGALDARDELLKAKRASANEWRRARGYPEWPDHGVYPDHLTPLVTLARHTGCRRGELFALRWRDVDLAGATITVKGDTAKSGQTRVIPLNSDAVGVLRAWRPTEAKGAALVFANAEGGALTDVKTAFLRVLKAARIEGFRFHDLRHDFASRLVQGGVDLNTVRELLGHADLKMTLRYAHLAPEHKAAAVAVLVR